MNPQPPSPTSLPSKTRRQERHEKRHDFFDAHPVVLFILFGGFILITIAASLAVRHFAGFGAALALALVLCVGGLLSRELVGPLCERCGRAAGTADEPSAAGTHTSVPQA